MSNVLIAIAVLVIGFVLVGYGVYENVNASRRSALAMTIGSKISRLAAVNQEQREDNGHMMLGPGEEASTGYDYYNIGQLQREAFGSVGFYYTAVAAGYFVCARSTDTSQTMVDAMNMVARDRPPAFVSGTCGVSSAAIGTYAIVSLKLY